MDTLDKIDTKPAASDVYPDTHETSGIEVYDEAPVDDLIDEVAEVSRKVNWWKIAGYAAVGAAVAIGGYAYLKAQQKPKTRLERLRSQLGLEQVDMSRLPASLRDIDFDRVRKTSRDVGIYAKKATHVGAKKVAELTR